MSRIALAATAATIALLAAAPASAAAITGLFNTGVGDAGVALTGGNGVVDTHWSILSSTSPGFAGQQAVTYYNPAYIGEDADSRWLALSSSGSPGNNTTVYRLSFDLTGLNHATAQISGLFSGDNTARLFLNGAATSFVTGNFGALHAFNLTSGFVAGVNHFDVEVQDFGAPTAFRIDSLAGTADLPGIGGAVPEPATWAMMLLGFFGLGSMLRSRRGLATA